MKDNVTLIPVRKKAGSRVKTKEDKPKLRVAAYCRVSTDSDEQAGSYEIQVAHYTDYISRNPEWELAGIYADDGISGTNTKKRERFNEMIDDCEAGKIDKVITKSISRFARNTLDCLKYVRKLKELNIDIFFEKENIHTLEASGELLLTIMASLAQQESQTLSQNVKLGLQFRYQDGKVQVNHNHFLGYTKDADIYRRIAWNNRGKRSVVWRCCTRLEHGPSACDAPTVLESELQMATVKAINMVLKCSDSMQDVLKENIEKVLRVDQTDGKLEKLNAILDAKQHELAQLAKKNEDYSTLADEIDELREQKQEILVEKAQTEGYKTRIQELGDLLKKECTELTEYDEEMVRNYIKGVKVFDDKFTVTFKAGIDIDIQR